MEFDKEAICEASHASVEALKNIETGPKQEPKIIAANMSNDELLQWMVGKVSAARQLKSALTEREILKQALSNIEIKVSQLTNSAALELLSTAQDPTHPP